MIALVFSDLEERILPDEFTLGGTALGVIFAAFVPVSGGILLLIFFGSKNQWLVSVCDSLMAAAICSGALWAVRALYEKVRNREGLGLGDVKMGAMIGAFLGIQGALLTLLVGSLLGVIVGLGYTWFTGKDASTYELPFGTFSGRGRAGRRFLQRSDFQLVQPPRRLRCPPSLPAIFIFAITYLVLAIGRLPGFRIDRTGAAIIGASFMLGVNALSLDEAYRAINFDTIILLFGMMIVVANLAIVGLLRASCRAGGGTRA